MSFKDKEFRGVFVDFKYVEIERVRPYDKNPKLHPPEQIAKIARSIEAFGWDQPIVVDKDYIIIKGHGRLQAAKLLGLTEVPVVVREDMTDGEARASRIADNQTAEAYWNIGNLLRELEALHGLDVGLGDTGFDEKEIKSLLPGMLETDQDYALGGFEGSIPAMVRTVWSDGKMGSSVAGSTMDEFLNAAKKVIVPCSGDMLGVAALSWVSAHLEDKSKLVVLDTNFGQRQWSFHQDYLTYLEATFGVSIIRGQDRLSDFLEGIKSKGYPTREKLWCCNQLRRASLVDQFTDPPEDTVIVLGTIPQEGLPPLRAFGRLLEEKVGYVAPFAHFDQKTGREKIVGLLKALNVKLSPIYKVTDQYFCPGCPQYSRPDFVFLKEFDLDLWIRWMIYFGRSQFCEDYLSSGAFNKQALELIGEGIEARQQGTFHEYAMPVLFQTVPQPKRVDVRPGDDYGYNPEKDKETADQRLDKPLGKWWEETEYSDAYKIQEAEISKYKVDRGDMSLEEWLKLKEVEARAQAKAEGLM